MSISQPGSSYLPVPPPEPSAPRPAEAPLVELDASAIVGSSTTMKRLRLQVRRIGPHFRTVLVSGEAGTGRELVARALHAMSEGAAGPFVVCHASAIEQALAECAGSSHATDDVVGLRNRSQRATLFLDGISEISLELQDRLLRVLREHESAQNRLDAPQRMDLRLIASTDEDLKILVSTGRFRQELYQRLATVDIALPPLRERMEDLPELARCFVGRFALLHGRSVREIADEAMVRMQEYRWPGNVRELESVLQSGVLQSEGEVLEMRHLPVFAGDRSEQSKDQLKTGAGASVRLQDVVERHVVQVLKDCGGNKLRAAEALGISRSTLYRMLDAGACANTSR